MTGESDLGRARLRFEHGEWVVWIPPTLPEHWDGDSQVGPAGETYFAADEHAEALAFLTENATGAPYRLARG